MKNIEFWLSLIGAIVVAFVIAIVVPGDSHEKVTAAIQYSGLVIIFLFGFMILAGIASGKIDISKILEEKSTDGATSSGASMSRFQLLIFTFVIAVSLFAIVVNTGGFPEKIPPEVLTLLGISATTYAVSKGIQAGSQSNGGAKVNGTSPVGAGVQPAAGAAVQPAAGGGVQPGTGGGAQPLPR
jgi:hypothetical protein